MADVVIFAAPPCAAVAGWAITSYFITGAFFGEFSSIYSNSAELQYAKTLTLHGRLLYEVHAVGALGPVLPVVLVASAAVALVRRDPRVLAPMGVLGGALGFDLMAFLDGSLTSGLRYFIIALPLGVLLVGALIAAIEIPRSAPNDRKTPARVARVLRDLAAVALILAVMIPTAVTTGAAIFNPNIGVYESLQLDFIFHMHHPSQSDVNEKHNYGWILALGDWFTRQHLPDGDIVVDNFTECVPTLITTINQPKLFVIPNDQDFQRILADPISFHTYYILESDPQGAPPTAISDQYPNLWSTGAGFTKMVHQFPSRADCPELRLFRVLHHSNTVS